MKRLATALCLLLPLPALAQSTPPLIIGHMKGQNEARIVFTTIREGCDEGSLMTWVVLKTGQISTYGCYSPAGGDLVVIWNDDKSVYSYPFDRLILSPEFRDYVASNP